MTREQFKDEILMAMNVILDSRQLSVLKDVLTDRLSRVEFANNTEIATIDNSNEYYLQLFSTFKGQRLSEKTMFVYMHTIEDFTAQINKPLLDVTANDVEFYLMKKSKMVSEVTLNNYKRNISAFYSFLVKKRLITFNPCDSVEAYTEVKKPIDHLNPEDLEQLKSGYKNSRDRAIVEFMRCTAVRVGELINVNIKDVDFISGKVIVYGHKTKTYRTVMIDKIAMGYLKKYLAERNVELDADEPLFADVTKKHAMTEDSVRELLKRIAKRSGMDRRVYPHLFRKTCATAIIRRGGSVEDAGDYLGHSEQSVTGKHYTYKDDSHVEQIFNRYVACV